MAALQPQDAVVATYREHGQALARGVPMDRAAWRRCWARPRGLLPRPRRLHAHLRRQRRFFGGNAIVGGGLPVAAGLAWRTPRLRPGAVTACFFGEGAVTEGAFHETMNLASIWRLPLLLSARTTCTPWACPWPTPRRSR